MFNKKFVLYLNYKTSLDGTKIHDFDNNILKKNIHNHKMVHKTYSRRYY